MKVRVDPDKCQGHMRCLQAVPSVFDEDEQGHSVTTDDDVPPDLEGKVRQAARTCPEQAIFVTD